MYIENINGPQDVKKLTVDEMGTLADEMRHALLIRASKHGGHFGPNFGMVEATIALHYVFESPKDKIVYDVSHQSYPHKMLTGRKDAYLYEEHYDDVTGYSNPHESEHFEINGYKKHCLENGLDDVDFLVQNRDKVEAWEAKNK